MKLHRLNCYKVELSRKFAQMEMNVVHVVANNESDERNKNYGRTKAQPNGLEWHEGLVRNHYKYGEKKTLTIIFRIFFALNLK